MTLLPLLSICAAWAGLALLLIGVGKAVGFLFFRQESSAVSSFWVGWFSTVLLLQIWHLALAVNGWTFALLVPISISGHWLTRRGWRGPRRSDVWAALAGALFVLWAANLALGPAQNPDVCLYHEEMLRWLNAFPIVVGLGNLSPWLGFNHGYYLFAALLNVGPFRDQAQHLANGLLFLGVALPGLQSLLRLAGARSTSGPAAFPARPSDVLWATAFAASIDQFLGMNLASPSADGAVWACNALLPILALQPIVDGEELGRDRVRLLTLIACGALAVKPMMLFVAGPFTIWALGRWLSRGHPVREMAGWLSGLTVIGVIPLLVRGIITTGYPLFPSTAFGLHLPWRVPEATARKIYLYARAFAHGRSRTVDYLHQLDYPWVGQWFSLAWLDNRFFLLPVLAMGAGLLWLLGRLVSGRSTLAMDALLPFLAAIALWWLITPDVRFIGPLPWLAAAALVLLSALPGREALIGPSFRVAGVAVLGAISWGATIGAGALLPRYSGLSPLPQESYLSSPLFSGEVFREGACCMDLLCGWHLASVRLRRPDGLAAGFASVPP